MKYIVYNSTANSGRGKESANKLKEKLEGEIQVQEGINLHSYKNFVNYLNEDDEVYVVGGDGTLNRLANELENVNVAPKLYFYPSGTGNDFLRDVKDKVNELGLIDVKNYIKNLPEVNVNGERRVFINGVGFGLDGMCCQKGDDVRAKSNKPVNYAGIAINLCLFGFKRKIATVTVDGKTYTFKNVWIAPTMKGRFYGSGMMVAPDQNRLDEEGRVTLVVWHGRSRLKTLINFPKIFSGDHIKLTKNIDVFVGKEISVEFNEPTALQVDGDTIRNVKSYSVKA